MSLSSERVRGLLDSAKKKMYAARLQRPTPYVDKTVYVGWNSMCMSAYLEAAKVLNLESARQFALRSLDRVLAEAWKPHAAKGGEGARSTQLLHVVAYSDPQAEHREVSGLLDDYAATALACLDAYEATADLSYFKFARAIGDAMIAKFFDAVSGGFFDAEPAAEGKSLGVLATRRKPLQDSPTPAGNPMAAIALLRLHHYTGDSGYRDKAEQTLETFAGVAEQFGIFAATYGIAVLHLLENPVQVVVIADNVQEQTAESLAAVAAAPFAFNKSVLRLTTNQAVAGNLPPALAATIPNLPGLNSGKSFAVLCSGFACQPPVAGPGGVAAGDGVRPRKEVLTKARQKNGADGLCMKSVSPKIASPCSAQLPAGYFSDLASNPDIRLTAISPSVVSRCRWCICQHLVVVVVGTVESGLRPGREPAERRLRHTCPLVLTSGSKS